VNERQRFAARTTTPVQSTIAELGRVMVRYGCEDFGYAERPDAAMVEFTWKRRQLRMVMPLERGDAQSRRQRWRALLLVCKAKLEAVESGVATVESEFLASLILPSGQTIGELMVPRIDRVLDGSVLAELEAR
jgi:hypothetical protein